MAEKHMEIMLGGHKEQRPHHELTSYDGMLQLTWYCHA
jgi:hypothetical protein